MPVRKFRSVEQMNQEVWRRPGDPTLYRTIASVWGMGQKLRPRRFEPGVRRFRTIDELESAADHQPPRP